MNNVNDYHQAGRPARESRTADARRQRLEAQARRKALSKPQKRILPMFDENDTVTLDEMSRVLGVLPADGAGPGSSNGWTDDFLRRWPQERDGVAHLTCSVQCSWRRAQPGGQPALPCTPREDCTSPPRGPSPGPNEG